jgi:hypothetical protein
MVEEMIRDHEVLRRFVDSREPLAIFHDIDVDQCLVGEPTRARCAYAVV